MSNKSGTAHLPATFVSGSIMRHIWIMTTTGAIGLVGVFVVDLIDMIFLSMLDSDAIIAGVGFAASISFFTVSMSIGISISMAALVSRMIGQRNTDKARRYVVNIIALALIVTSIMSAVIWFNLPFLFNLLGAADEPLNEGVSYLQILIPSLPLFSAGMVMSAAIRAVGDARLAMLTTLLGGVVNAILDPIFIFVLDLGIEGAAMASVLARCFLLALAIYGVSTKHKLLKRFVLKEFLEDFRPIFKIAGPAMLTNVATPVGNAIVISSIAVFGGSYVAGFAIIGRISPVAFALVFALSGAIAPIIGQNYGALKFERIRQTLKNSLIFSALYVSLVSILLWMLQNPIIALFKLEGEAAELMSVFCTWVAITFIFNGAQFVANTTFNNLGKPMYATGFNVAKSTLGTLPFVAIGSQLGGAAGIILGVAVGGMIFAVAAVIIAFKHIGTLAHNADNCETIASIETIKQKTIA